MYVGSVNKIPFIFGGDVIEIEASRIQKNCPHLVKLGGKLGDEAFIRDHFSHTTSQLNGRAFFVSKVAYDRYQVSISRDGPAESEIPPQEVEALMQEVKEFVKNLSIGTLEAHCSEDAQSIHNEELKTRFKALSVEEAISKTASSPPSLKKFYSTCLVANWLQLDVLRPPLQDVINLVKQKSAPDTDGYVDFKYSKEEAEIIQKLSSLLIEKIDLTLFIQAAHSHLKEKKYSTFWSLLLFAYVECIKQRIGKVSPQSGVCLRAFENCKETTQLLQIGDHLRFLGHQFSAVNQKELEETLHNIQYNLVFKLDGKKDCVSPLYIEEREGDFYSPLGRYRWSCACIYLDILLKRVAYLFFNTLVFDIAWRKGCESALWFISCCAIISPAMALGPFATIFAIEKLYMASAAVMSFSAFYVGILKMGAVGGGMYSYYAYALPRVLPFFGRFEPLSFMIRKIAIHSLLANWTVIERIAHLKLAETSEEVREIISPSS